MTHHLFVPPSLRRLAAAQLFPGPSLRHAALEYDLVAEHRPALLVDLGTGDAGSFFAYCQAMIDHDVDGTCYAIDTWSDATDEARGPGLDAIRAHGRRHYPGITYFVGMPPADALRHFDEGTVDLLRVDATRADVLTESGVEPWLARVKPGGLVLCHGALTEPALWSRLVSEGTSVVFAEGKGGLGVFRKNGPSPTTELLRLLFVENEAASLERFYGTVAEGLELRRILDATKA